MNFKKLFQNILPDVIAIVIFLLISTCYFITPLGEDLVLGGHDSVASIGLGQEQREYVQSHNGETTRWSNALFSGMPTYQTAPSYSATRAVNKLADIYALGTNHWFPAISYLFLYLLGFYILLRAFNFKSYLAALGAVVWAFSSYFLIIIAAGHIWKVMALAFIPPTIGGLILCYRKKYLWGGGVTALFTAFQVVSNHLQMTYYFLFVMLFLVLAYGIDSIRKHEVGHWFKATGVIIIAGLLGVAANLPNLYHTYQYAQESTRGKAELSPVKGSSEASQQATSGLDRDYITQWSYGIDETLTLLIPNFKGGGSSSILDKEGLEEMEGYDDFYQGAAQTQYFYQQQGKQVMPPGLSLYWGDQPMTVGPVYVGAFVCFLFLLGLFYVRGPIKWALLAATILSLLFAWGKNSPALTNFFIDHLPMYAKFRTVSSALVIAEFTIPLLAVLCLYQIIKQPTLFRLSNWKESSRRMRIGLPVAAIFTLGFCLLFWLVPSAAGDCISTADHETFREMQIAGFDMQALLSYKAAITSIHHAILSADALRSAVILAIGIALLFLFAEGKIKDWLLCILLAVLCLFDLWQIDKRYLNNESFEQESVQLEGFNKTAADEQILQDKSYYRVLNLAEGNPFNETTNKTSYYHHSVGGYHAAKLHRYQDLIDRQLNGEIAGFINAFNAARGDMTQVSDSVLSVLNMLNAKYFILSLGGTQQAVLNPHANGNGWFVRKLDFVKTADEEMQQLSTLDTKHAAVADEKFRPALQGSPLDSGKVQLTAYEPNQLSYDIESQKGGVVVFSEIYYPDWTVTLDGKPAELGRVNYVLRALKVPAGKHKVTMEFRPASVGITNRIGFAALGLTLLFFFLALVRTVAKKKTGEISGKI